MQTDAEKHFDAILAQRRAAGRKTYGKGLTHTDAYDWNVMAMEEAIDLAQYLAAENLRLRQQVELVRSILNAPPIPTAPTDFAKEGTYPVPGSPDYMLIYTTTTTGTGNGRK